MIQNNHNNKKTNISLIFFASLGPPPYTGGIENVVKTLVNSELSSKYLIKLFDTYRRPKGNRPTLLKVLYSLKLSISCVSFIIKNKPTLAHIHFCTYTDFWKHSICLLLVKIFGIKTVFHLHGGNFKVAFTSYNVLKKSLVKLIFKLPDITIALSDYWANFLAEITDPSKIRVIGNPVNFDNFTSANWGNKLILPLNILLLGRVGHHKGHYDALKAMQIIIKSYPDSKLIFAGDDEKPNETKKLQDLAEHMKLTDSIKFIGPITGEKKYKLFNSCSIMILPSYGENLPLSLIEGMAAKLPIIATNVGAIPELLEHNKLGFIINPGDYRALAQNIMKVAKTDLSDIEAITSQANKKVKSLYSTTTITNKLDFIYKEIIPS